LHRNWVEIALQELDAEDRALLELSVVREISDDDIAGLLGVDAGRIEERREAALHRLAELLGETGDGGIEWITDTMRELPASRWNREEDPGHTGPIGIPDEIPPEPAPAAEPPAPEPPPGEPRRWSSVRPAFLGALVIAALVALVVSLAGKDDSEPSSSGSPAPSTSPGTTTGPSAQLGHISPSSASGAADLVRTGKGTLLHVSVKGLPPPPKGGYVVWLYNSITDARDLGGSLRGTFTLQAALPGDYRRYRFVDISREPADGNRNHSGQSVLRTPLPR
jgi:Anti-sigma-K factor rskA